jgi:hypothetical protein
VNSSSCHSDAKIGAHQRKETNSYGVGKKALSSILALIHIKSLLVEIFKFWP